MDDLFGFGVPDSGSASSVFSGLEPQGLTSSPASTARDVAPAAPQHGSRRAAREAEGNRPAPDDTPRPEIVPSSLPKRKQKAMARSARDRQKLSRPSGDRKAVARAARELGPVGPAGRKLKRAELALMNASAPKPPRKNPLSVLLTMAAVGGMFAVIGLPAYALVPPVTATPTKTEADVQSILVSSSAAPLSVSRDGYHATTQADLDQMSKDALRAEQDAAYNASGARGMGDDYPWPYELMEGQGGSLSPLNYYYRECVDFVAWRLNRDAGSYAAPFKWVWSNLTPFGGNGGQWEYNWQQHGWPISDTPIKGAVAYTGGNHVAYVKSLNADGTITIEEYNYIHGMYSQRTMTPASIVAAGGAFLYPPP
jgi:surface antigen